MTKLTSQHRGTVLVLQNGLERREDTEYSRHDRTFTLCWKGSDKEVDCTADFFLTSVHIKENGRTHDVSINMCTWQIPTKNYIFQAPTGLQSTT